MAEMGPKEAREFFGGGYSRGEMAAKGLAVIAAWEADREYARHAKDDKEDYRREMLSLRERLEAAEKERDLFREALAADLAYHANNSGINMRWRKTVLASLPEHWAERIWPALEFALAAGKG